MFFRIKFFRIYFPKILFNACRNHTAIIACFRSKIQLEPQWPPDRLDRLQNTCRLRRIQSNRTSRTSASTAPSATATCRHNAKRRVAGIAIDRHGRIKGGDADYILSGRNSERWYSPGPAISSASDSAGGADKCNLVRFCAVPKRNAYCSVNICKTGLTPIELLSRAQLPLLPPFGEVTVMEGWVVIAPTLTLMLVFAERPWLSVT